MKRKLGEICRIVSGSTPKTGIPEYWDGDLKWVTPAELNDESRVVNDTKRTITELGATKTGLTPLPAGTVLLSSRAPIGKVAITGCEMYCNQGFKNLICSNSINNKYLYWFLKGKTQYLNSLGRGATFKEISKTIVADIEINLPDIEEQKKIANRIEKIDSRLIMLRAEISRLDELTKARFVEMFGGSKTYPIKPLSDIAEYWNGLTYKPTDVSNDGTIVLRSSNIQNMQLDLNDIVRVKCDISNKKMVKENDILMCSRNGSAKLVGKVALIPNLQEQMSFGAFMMIIRSEYYSYLMTYFQLPEFRSQISTGTTTINQITRYMLDKVKLPVPDKASIDEFAAFVAQVDKSKFAVQKSLEKTQQLFDSLMQEYFG